MALSIFGTSITWPDSPITYIPEGKAVDDPLAARGFTVERAGESGKFPAEPFRLQEAVLVGPNDFGSTVEAVSKAIGTIPPPAVGVSPATHEANIVKAAIDGMVIGDDQWDNIKASFQGSYKNSLLHCALVALLRYEHAATPVKGKTSPPNAELVEYVVASGCNMVSTMTGTEKKVVSVTYGPQLVKSQGKGQVHAEAVVGAQLEAFLTTLAAKAKGHNFGCQEWRDQQFWTNGAFDPKKLKVYVKLNIDVRKIDDKFMCPSCKLVWGKIDARMNDLFANFTWIEPTR